MSFTKSKTAVPIQEEQKNNMSQKQNNISTIRK